MVKYQSSHIADYHGAVFGKLYDGGPLKHLREFSGITQYRTQIRLQPRSFTGFVTVVNSYNRPLPR